MITLIAAAALAALAPAAPAHDPMMNMGETAEHKADWCMDMAVSMKAMAPGTPNTTASNRRH
jgi:hypothetical protein